MTWWRKSKVALGACFRLRWPTWAPPVAIFLLALGLRLWRLGEANLWWDEALAIWAVRKGLVGVTLWTAGDVHPPLYFWALWAWVKVFGTSPLAMRSFSALFGAWTALVAYYAGRLLGERRGIGREAAWWSGLWVALARFHIWWSQEMRMYALAGLLVLLSLSFFIRWLRAIEDASPGSERRARLLWLGYVVASIGALYTVYLTASVILVENLVVLGFWLARKGGRRPLVKGWIGAQGTIGVAIGAWLLFAWGRMPTWSRTAGPPGVKFFMQLYATLLTTGISTYIHRYGGLLFVPLATLALGGALFWGRWWPERRARHAEMLEGITFFLAATVPACAVYLSTIPRGLFYTPNLEARYFLPYAPAFWVLLGVALAEVRRRWRVLGGALAGILLAQWLAVLPSYYGGRFYRDTLQTMVRTIVSQTQPGDAVLLDSGGRYPIFLYDYEGLPTGVWKPPFEAVSLAEEPLREDQVEAWMADKAPLYERIWLAEVDVALTDPERLVAQHLERAYHPVAEWHYGANRLVLYDRQGKPPTLTATGLGPQVAANVPVGDGGLLLGWDLPVRRVPQDAVVHLSLLWARMPAEPVEIVLRGPKGQAVMRRTAGQTARGLSVRQQFDFPIGLYMAPGTYAFEMSPPLPEGKTLGAIRVVGARGQPIAGEPQARLNVRFGDQILLEGYALYRGVRPELLRLPSSDTVILDLYWRALGTPPQDYTVFTHLLGAAYNPRTQGPVWGQHDAPPMEGAWPTSTWRAGDRIVDRHILVLDAEAPEGDYSIEVGLYDLASGERLPAFSEDGQPLGDHALLGAVVRLKVGK